eukprot:COSAG02_NODE_2088_length_9877_cov_3.833299_1_plen_1373_part_00
MPQINRKRRSPSPPAGPSPDPNVNSRTNSLSGATMMMAHRSIISVGTKKTPFGSITAEETQVLRRTLADRRRAWARPGSQPLSKERTLAILRRKEKRSVMISQLFQFTLTALVYVSALLMQRPILESHDLESAIEAVFVNQPVRSASGGFTFQEISSHADVFTWMDEVFLPVVYTDTWYNGDDREDVDEHTIGAQTVFVGGFRLLQIRGGDGSGSRCYDSVWSAVQPRCLDNGEDQETYGPAGAEGFSYACDPSDDAVCGFFIDFAIGNHTFAEQVERFDALEAGRWLDERTRYLYIDTSMYNNNYKLWARVALVLHFDLAGSVLGTEEIEVLIVDPYELSTGIDGQTFFRMLLELIFILLMFKTINDERHKCRLAGGLRMYIREYGWLNTIGDGLSILANLIVVCFWIRMISLPQRLELTRKADRVDEPFDRYFELSELSRWDEHYVGINSANIVLQTLRSLRFFQVTTQGERLIHTLKSLAPELCAFVPILTAVIIGYAMSGMIFFGMDYETWSTPGQAIFNVWTMNFGLYDTTRHIGGNLGEVAFVYSALIIIAIIFMNVFLAMVMTSWENLDQLDEEHEYLIPVSQTLLGHDLPMMLHIPTSIITDLINDMPALVDGHEKEDMTPEELEQVMEDAKVSEKQQTIISSWFWAHPTTEQMLASSPSQSDDVYAAPMRRAPRNRKHRRNLSEDMDTLRQIYVESEHDRDPAAKPRKWLVAELRNMRQRHVWIQELCHFILFSVVYVLVLFRERDTAAMHAINRLVEQSLAGLENNAGIDFNKIAIMDDVFTWLDEAFIPAIYDDLWYNGDRKELINQHTFGPGHTRMIGGWRILQNRYSENGTSCYVGRFHRLRPVCVTDELDKLSFGPGVGNTIVSSDPNDDPAIFSEVSQSFKYACDQPLGRAVGSKDCGYMLHATFANNSGIMEQAKNKVTMLKKYRWLDRQTRALRIGMTLYNDNMKRWISVELILEVSRAGGVKSSRSVDVLHLSPFDSQGWTAQASFDLILQICFVILTVAYIRDVAYKLKHATTATRRARFHHNTMCHPAQFGLELTCLVLSVAVIIMWIYFLSMDFSRLHEFGLSGEEKGADAKGYIYPDVTAAVDWEISWTSLNGANVMLQTLRGITYFQLSKSGSRLMGAVHRSGPQLANFIPIYMVVICGFAFSGHLMFGIRDSDWSLFANAFYNVFNMQVNLFSAFEVYDKSRWSVFWIYTLMVLSVVILTNVFVAIIMATWDEIGEEIDAKQHEVERDLRKDCQLLLVHSSEWKKAADALEASTQQFLTETEVVNIIQPVVQQHCKPILAQLWDQRDQDGVRSIVQPAALLSARSQAPAARGSSFDTPHSMEGDDNGAKNLEDNLAAISFSPPAHQQP